MEFSILEEKKKDIQKEIIKNKTSAAIMRYLYIILFIVGIIGGGLLLFYRLTSPDIYMVNVNGVLQKNVGWAIISSSFLIVPCLLSSLFLKKFVENFAGQNCGYRVDESLTLNPDALIYSYRIKHQSLPNERILITIPFSETKVEYDSRTSQLLFFGNIQDLYYRDFLSDAPDGSCILDKFIIHDYFEPSLYEKIENKIKIVPKQ